MVNTPDSQWEGTDGGDAPAPASKRASKPPVALEEMSADAFLSWAGENGW